MHSEYQFGYEDRELQRLGDQHEVWADTNRALLHLTHRRELSLFEVDAVGRIVSLKPHI